MIDRKIIEKSTPFKEREILKKQYVEEISRVTDLVLGEKGIEMVKKYPNAFSYLENVYIPGAIRYTLNDYIGYDTVSVLDKKIPHVHQDINKIHYGYNLGFDEVSKIIGEEEIKTLQNLRQRLEDNAATIAGLLHRINKVIQNSFRDDIKKDFPELYQIIQEHEKQKNN